MDTVLHELSHNRFGPHDANFHALWDQLRDEYVALTKRGFTGEPFLTKGHLLGGKRIPRDEARRIARNAADERRKKLSLDANRKLGGAGPKLGDDIRSTIVSAIFGRMNPQGCASDRPKGEQKALVTAAGVNGFKTKAEEDDANEVAIQQALWELAQKDREEMRKQRMSLFGSASVNGGDSIGSLSIDRLSLSNAYDSSSQATKTNPPNPEFSDDPSLKKPPPQYIQLVEDDLWQCTNCTLINKEEDLSCDACEVARPGTEPPKAAPPIKAAAKKPPPKVASTRSTAQSRSSASRSVLSTPRNQIIKAVVRPAPTFWTCEQCSNLTESEWWTCTVCGMMKSKS